MQAMLFPDFDLIQLHFASVFQSPALHYYITSLLVDLFHIISRFITLTQNGSPTQGQEGVYSRPDPLTCPPAPQITVRRPASLSMRSNQGNFAPLARKLWKLWGT